MEIKASYRILSMQLSLYFVIKSNERSKDSYIGLADFFFRKKSQNIDALLYMHLFSSIEIC